MDFNFLVFPKPVFEEADDTFYSKLVLVPRQQNPIVKSIRPKINLANRASTLQQDSEGIPMHPRVVSKRSLVSAVNMQSEGMREQTDLRKETIIDT